MNPFAVFGLEPTLDVEPDRLEARYLDLSRATHPDHHQSTDVETQTALLARAAAVNDAYRVLRDPWRRAQALVEMRAPDAMPRAKTLAPAFLAEALDLAEAVAHAAGDGDAAARLRADLARILESDWRDVRTAVAAGDWARAATKLHEANYHRKALHDLGR